jgi:predicted phosphodiesterase
MRIAIFSDIHANLEALVAVLADISSQKCTHRYCLGDVVGYGASPRECVALIRAHGVECMRGNHDELASLDCPPIGFNSTAAQSIIWTRSQLSKEDLQWLGQRPYYKVLPELGITICHANITAPAEWQYVDNANDAQAMLRAQRTTLCFFGHTHIPAIFVKIPDGRVRTEPRDEITLEPNCRYAVNVGSIGQPRDDNPHSCYVVYDTQAQTIKYRRVEYLLAAAQDKIRKAGLPERLAVRLEQGQ